LRTAHRLRRADMHFVVACALTIVRSALYADSNHRNAPAIVVANLDFCPIERQQ
jgi:hypothetical protein